MYSLSLNSTTKYQCRAPTVNDNAIALEEGFGRLNEHFFLFVCLFVCLFIFVFGFLSDVVCVFV
jgi:hypothetical protein